MTDPSIERIVTGNSFRERSTRAGAMMLRLVFSSVVCVLLGGCLPDCSEGSEAVRRARSLSPEQLSQLYDDMQALVRSPKGRNGSGPGPSPQPFEYLDPIRINRTGPRASIMLEGCFDEFVHLRFNFADQREPRRIVLQFGTGTKEVLWEEARE